MLHRSRSAILRITRTSLALLTTGGTELFAHAHCVGRAEIARNEWLVVRATAFFFFLPRLLTRQRTCQCYILAPPCPDCWRSLLRSLRGPTSLSRSFFLWFHAWDLLGCGPYRDMGPLASSTPAHLSLADEPCQITVCSVIVLEDWHIPRLACVAHACHSAPYG